MKGDDSVSKQTDYYETLYRAYLLSIITDDFDNTIDTRELSYKEFCEELKKTKEGDIMNSRS